MRRTSFSIFICFLGCFFTLLLVPLSSNGQVTDQAKNGVLINLSDSSRFDVEKWSLFDTDSSIYLEIFYDTNGYPIRNNYVLKNGTRITNYTITTDSLLAVFFKNEVMANFSYENIVGCGKGLVVINYLINEKCEVIDVRLTRGIDNWYNLELLRCAKLSLNTTVECGNPQGQNLLSIVFFRF
jgi:hypothetical protein